MEGNPHLCNSTIKGVTNEITAGVKNHEVDKVDGSLMEEEKTVDYTATGISSQIKCNFTIEMFDLSTSINLLDEAKTTFCKFHCYYLCILILTSSIDTTHVDNVTITDLSNGSVRVQCILVEGSTADGCRVVFTNTNEGAKKLFELNISVLMEDGQISAERNVLLSVSGTYDVKAYDIVNGTVLEDVSYDSIPPVTITILPSSTPLSSTSSVDRSSGK